MSAVLSYLLQKHTLSNTKSYTNTTINMLVDCLVQYWKSLYQWNTDFLLCFTFNRLELLWNNNANFAELRAKTRYSQESCSKTAGNLLNDNPTPRQSVYIALIEVCIINLGLKANNAEGVQLLVEHLGFPDKKSLYESFQDCQVDVWEKTEKFLSQEAGLLLSLPVNQKKTGPYRYMRYPIWQATIDYQKTWQMFKRNQTLIALRKKSTATKREILNAFGFDLSGYLRPSKKEYAVYAGYKACIRNFLFSEYLAKESPVYDWNRPLTENEPNIFFSPQNDHKGILKQSSSTVRLKDSLWEGTYRNKLFTFDPNYEDWIVSPTISEGEPFGIILRTQFVATVGIRRWVKHIYEIVQSVDFKFVSIKEGWNVQQLREMQILPELILDGIDPKGTHISFVGGIALTRKRRFWFSFALPWVLTEPTLKGIYIDNLLYKKGSPEFQGSKIDLSLIPTFTREKEHTIKVPGSRITHHIQIVGYEKNTTLHPSKGWMLGDQPQTWHLVENNRQANLIGLKFDVPVKITKPSESQKLSTFTRGSESPSVKNLA